MLDKLSGERTRWDAMMVELRTNVGAMAGSSLLAAGFLIYSPTSPSRCAPTCSRVVGRLPAGRPAQAGHGHDQRRHLLDADLPLDRGRAAAVEGAGAAHRQALERERDRHPQRALHALIIDPSRATEWLKANLQAGAARSRRSCRTRRASRRRSSSACASARRSSAGGRQGRADPRAAAAARPLPAGAALRLSVGDKAVDYADGFRMFLATRNPNVLTSCRPT